MLFDTLFLLASIFSTFLTVLVIYVVLFHSPRSMQGYGRYIINFTLFDFLFSFTLGVLVKPTPLFPFAAGYIEGPLKYLGDYGADLSVVLIINTAGYCLSTQCCCLVYRFAVLQNTQWWMDFVMEWKSWIYTYLISSCVSALSVFIFAQIQPSQTRVRELLLRDGEEFHMDPPCVDGKVIMYMDYRNNYGIAAGVFISVGFSVAEIVSLIFIFLLLRMLEEKKESFSKITYKLHRQLTIALGVQLLTPFLFIILPVSYMIIHTAKRTLDLDTGHFIINFIELYGCSNSLVTLYFVKPYRDFLLTKVRVYIRLVTRGKYGNVERRMTVAAPESGIVSALM